jgi:Zn finger protein HypA/HybF involved in hydrogenase expression
MQSNYQLHIKVKLDDTHSNDTHSNIQFGDSVCTCKSCNHRIALDCIDANCTCCSRSDHSMVLDGIEGFSSKSDT